MLFKPTVLLRPRRRQPPVNYEGKFMMSGYYLNYPPSHGMHEGGADSNPPPPEKREARFTMLFYCTKMNALYCVIKIQC